MWKQSFDLWRCPRWDCIFKTIEGGCRACSFLWRDEQGRIKRCSFYKSIRKGETVQLPDKEYWRRLDKDERTIRGSGFVAVVPTKWKGSAKDD